MIFKNLRGCSVILDKTLSSSIENSDPRVSDVNRKDPTSDGGNVDSMSHYPKCPVGIRITRDST